MHILVMQAKSLIKLVAQRLGLSKIIVTLHNLLKLLITAMLDAVKWLQTRLCMSINWLRGLLQGIKKK